MRESVQRSLSVVSLMAMVAAALCAADVSAAPEAKAGKAPAHAARSKQALALHWPGKPFELRVPRLDSLQSLSGLGAALAPLKGLELGHCGLSSAAERGLAASPVAGNDSN